MLRTTHVRAALIEGVPVAALTTEKIGEYEAHAIEVDLSGLGAAHRWRMAVDFSQVRLLASVGIGLLIKIQKLAGANPAESGGKGRVVYFGMDANVRSLLAITRLDKGMTIVEDQGAAVALLKGL
jgi:anti-anti-sigma regulatory factor